MLIPGSNILQMALSLIAAQSFQYIAYITRTIQPNGQYLTTYASPITLQGSVQPVPRTLFEQLGLDLQKNYVNIYVSRDILDISRDVSGDQIIYNGNNYQVLSKTAWDAVDGWDAILCVQVQNIAIITQVTPPAIQNYNTLQTLTFSVTFNANAMVAAVPYIGLSAIAGVISGNAAYVSGSGTNTLVFSYIVNSTDTASGLVVAPIINGIITANGLAANGSFIAQDLSGITLNA